MAGCSKNTFGHKNHTNPFSSAWLSTQVYSDQKSFSHNKNNHAAMWQKNHLRFNANYLYIRFINAEEICILAQ